MAAHNYDGDMLTDEVAQVHRSPGFITSNLIGKNDDGSLIKGKKTFSVLLCDSCAQPWFLEITCAQPCPYFFANYSLISFFSSNDIFS